MADKPKCTREGCKRTESCSHTACPLRKIITAQPSDGVDMFKGGYFAVPTQREDYDPS